jgi:hypothetical protein
MSATAVNSIGKCNKYLLHLSIELSSVSDTYIFWCNHVLLLVLPHTGNKMTGIKCLLDDQRSD